MADLNFQDFSTVQSNLQTKPVTVAGAATIAPVSLITFVSGTGTAIATITPPVSGAHMLVLVFTNATPNTLSAAGNVQRAVTPLQNIPVLLFYDPVSAKYWATSYAS